MLGLDTRAEKLAALMGSGIVGVLLFLVFRPSTTHVAPTKKPPPQQLVQQPPDPKAEAQRRREHLLRLDACAQIEAAMVKDGRDVEVMPMRDNDAHIVVVGPAVNRFLVRQFAASGIGKRLKERGIWKVTFMRDQFSWVGEWDLFYNKLEAPAD